jgi:hypothetical protein
MKLVQVEAMRLVQVEGQYVNNLNAENTIQIVDIDGEGMLKYLFCIKILAADSKKPNKLNRYLETLHADKFPWETKLV